MRLPIALIVLANEAGFLSEFAQFLVALGAMALIVPAIAYVFPLFLDKRALHLVSPEVIDDERRREPRLGRVRRVLRSVYRSRAFRGLVAALGTLLFAVVSNKLADLIPWPR